MVREERPDAIVDLAAVSSAGASWAVPYETLSVNAFGALDVLEAVRREGLAESTKILLVGSSEEYAASNAPLRETDPLNASSPYGASKIMQEQSAAMYEEMYGLQIARVRAFNHTGIGQPDTFALPSFCKQVAEIDLGLREPVLRVGNIEVERDFSDVRDIVRAYRTLLEQDHSGEVFNVGSGHAWRLGDLVDTIVNFLAKDISIEVDPSRIRLDETLRIAADPSKMQALTGRTPDRDLKSTLREMCEKFRADLR